MNEENINLQEESPLKILVVSQKGGVGKSTLSANFSAYCGSVKKKKSLLLDLPSCISKLMAEGAETKECRY